MPKAPTKAELEVVAKSFNRIMKLDPPIEMGKKVKIDQLKADVIEASDLITPADKLSGPAKKTLSALGIKVPAADGGETKKPGAKTKQTASTKPKNDTGGSKKLPATTFIVHLVCDKDGITKEEVRKELDSAGYSTSDSTIAMQMADTLKAVNYLKEKGKLK